MQHVRTTAKTLAGGALIAGLALCLAIVGGCGGADRDAKPDAAESWMFPPKPILGTEERFVGHGARGAALLWREGSTPPRDVVVFLHGWLPRPPSTYGEWLRHLVSDGNTVVYPVYQDPRTEAEGFLDNAIAGIAAGLRAADADPTGVVAVGDTVGGALAFDYAAVAAEHGLAPPRGVLAAFPGRNPPLGELTPADLSHIPPQTMLQAIAGPGDPLPDGEAQAWALLRGATAVPNSQRRYLAAPRLTGPTGDGPPSRRAFWEPLDRLIDEVRAG